ncbi:hypothetical protein DFP72DRAFT_592113 [Ephemerocybe angulata]|uniref:Ubiquitin-like domain-containing protein n=1 Tax=Ephemerocybe angulata TaxID=980116 RepID=A0A8H6IAI2_9AGAR|nr:hypothetical protein DFP72DRAFT_592113 [Tulosesus angulatus]
MELTFLNDLGQSFVVEIDPNMELENVMALLEAESGIPVAEQSISHEGRELTNPKATIRELGVQGDSAMMLLRRKVASSVSGRPMEQDSEMMRLQLLGNPDMMRELQQAQPELAEAAQNNPQRFAELLRQTRERQYSAELEQQREIERLNMDPFDVEAQQKIEDAIRQQAVMENMQHALEYSPEFFGRVCMLYIQLEPRNSRSMRAHAPDRHPVRRYRAWSGHSQDSRTRPLCATQGRGPPSPLFIHNHGGPRRRPPLRS